jgi:hypothetical protein
MSRKPQPDPLGKPDIVPITDRMTRRQLAAFHRAGKLLREKLAARRRPVRLEVVPQHEADALFALFGYTRQTPAKGGESKTTETRKGTRGKAGKGQGRIITRAKEYTGDKPTKNAAGQGREAYPAPACSRED